MKTNRPGISEIYEKMEGIRKSRSKEESVQEMYLKLLREEAGKEGRKDREESAAFPVASGIAFSTALASAVGLSFVPHNLQSYMCEMNVVSQDTAGNGTFSMHHIVSRLQICAVRVPDRDTSTEGFIDYCFMRKVDTNGAFCHMGPPPLTSTFATRKMYAQLDNAGGTYRSIMSKPVRSTVEPHAFLAERVETTSWMDEAPLIRLLLLGDLAADDNSWMLDPIWGQVCPDGQHKRTMQCPPSRTHPKKTVNITKVLCQAVPIDVWVGLKTGVYHYSERCGLSYEAAVIPLKISMLQSSGCWLYIAAFLSTRIWNGRHIFKSTFVPNEQLSEAKPEHEFDFFWRPNASLTVVEGRTETSDILLVLTDVTSSSSSKTVCVGEVEVPIWQPERDNATVDVITSLYEAVGLGENGVQHIQRCWSDAWLMMQQRVATGTTTARAIQLVAEATRRVHIGAAVSSTEESTINIYGLKLKQKLPSLLKAKWNYCDWEGPFHDVKNTLHDWLEFINASWISPYGLHAELHGMLYDAEFRDWLKSLSGIDISLCCHEASAEGRMARFIGLITTPTPLILSYIAAVQENVSTVASLQAVCTAWTQAWLGVGWLKWASRSQYKYCNDIDFVCNDVVSESSLNYVSRIDPGQWWYNIVRKVYGVPGLDPERDSTVLFPWWALKFILQKVNYIIPGKLQYDEKFIADQFHVGLYASKSADWQLCMRATSLIAAETSADVAIYAVNSSRSPMLVDGFSHLSWARSWATVGENMFSFGSYLDKLKQMVDVAGVVTPLTNSLVRGYSPELLILRTRCLHGSGAGDQQVCEGWWHSPWWDWLLTGIQVTPTFNLPGASSALVSFLRERYASGVLSA